MIISLEFGSPRTSSDLPKDSVGPTSDVLLFGLAPGDACRAVSVATDAVGSYPAVSPLPDPLRAIGGLFSVAPVSDHSAWVLPSALPAESGLSSHKFPCERPPDLLQCAKKYTHAQQVVAT